MKKNIYNRNKYTAHDRVVVALAGNPNSGKTTLFNLLTGSNQKVGNWPGVTVERKSGACVYARELDIADTPGCYSLTPFTPEEQITSDYLKTAGANVIVNVVDSTSPERNLLLTTQLLELGKPVVVALNMQDEAAAKGIEIDARKLQSLFGCEFVPVSAAKGEGVEALVRACIKASKQTVAPRTLADNPDERYKLIENAVRQAVSTRKTSRLETTDKIDKILLNKWLAFPIFAITMMAVFYLSVGGLGGWLTGLINEKLTPLLQSAAENALRSCNMPRLTSLVTDGVISGVMSVAGFLPQVMILFGCIALLEACGYMSRIAFITDKLLHGLGLSGRSFVCMVLGCGCSVPAIVSTRTIKDAAERETTVTLAPFVPCSAKLAVIAFFTSYIFDGNALFAVSFYFASIIAVIIGGLALKLLRKDKTESVFLMELPPYRLPKAQNVLRQMWERGKAFLIKAGTIILAASVILWALTNLDFRFMPTDAENSMLADIGKAISPIFAPLGFDDGGCGWKFTVATLSGIAAKETVVATLQILLPNGIQNAISPLGAYSFVLYNLLTVPCIAAVSSSFSEQGEWKKGLRSVVFQIITAYLTSLCVYQLGRLALTYPSAFATTLILCSIMCAMYFALFRRRGKCAGCSLCKKQ